MKKLEISAFTSTASGFPAKEGTWDFLQQANQECFLAIIASLAGGSYAANTMYRIYGCKTVYDNSIGFPGNVAFSITAGALFYNGEIYLVDAASFVIGSGSIDVSIAKTQYSINADPVTFTGGSSNNVHNIYKIKFSAQGVAQPSNIFFGTFNPTIADTLLIDSGWIATSYSSPFVADGTNPIRIRRIGNRVTISGRLESSAHAPVTTDVDVFVLNDIFMPSKIKKFVCADEITPAAAQIKINAGGTVTLMGSYVTCRNYGIYFEMSYLVD